METKLNLNKVLFNKLNNYFKDNTRISLICDKILIIVTKEDLFYCIDICNENIASFIINDDNSVIQSMIIKDLCYKQINDIKISYWSDYCFARNENNIYCYDIENGVIKEYISEQKIIDMCCDIGHPILLTQSGKVYEYEVNDNERKKSEKYIHFELKSLKNYSFENEKIVMISCGLRHSLAVTESGRVFGWGHNQFGQLGVDVEYSIEPIIIELNDLKIQKISCGVDHSLLLSCDGDIYAFGLNYYGEVGNGTRDKQRFPIKLELNNKFIDIASHPYYEISMSQSIDGIYYVWGRFEDKPVLSPQPTKYESFEDILISKDFIDNIKTFEKLIEFKGSFGSKKFHRKMGNNLNSNIVLFSKLNDYFKHNIRMSLVHRQILIIVTKEDLFYCIHIDNKNIPSFIINNDNSVIKSMIIKDLCHKQINDIKIINWLDYCFARNEYKIYCYDIKNGVMKEYISEEKIIDMCCVERYTILLTQSGKVYEYEVNDYERENSEKYIHFELKSFKNYSFENEKIVMISCGYLHSLALTESGRVFGWGDNQFGQLGVDVEYSIEPIIIELNDLKIQKISCGPNHSLLLSCDGDIYAFGGNYYGEVGNGTRGKQRFPIKLELNNKFIDIASHPYFEISISQSIDGIHYVWGLFEDKPVLSPQPTKYESFEDILISYYFINNIKTFGKLIEFKDSFVKNGFYSKHFEEIQKLGFGSFGSVFKVKIKDRDYHRRRGEYSAIKRIEFFKVDKNEIIREYLNYKIITRNYSKNEYLVKHFDAWFEEKVVSNQSGISLYIEMELCDQTLDDVTKEFDKESHFKTSGTLTPVGYYIASQIFIQILKGVNHLHTQNPPLIHRDLKPANILLKKDEDKGVCVKIADIGLAVIHKYSEQSHTLDKGTPKYMAPEVIKDKKYDTKADIYSLGVIFENLFSLDMNE
jgi:alpha-tubulin suppressor-like RCC1 family protein